MPPPLPQEQRDEIQSQLELGRETAQIVHNTGVSRSQIDKMNRNLARYGAVVAPGQVRGAPRLMNEEMETHLLQWIDLHPTKYLDEMCWFIYDHYDVEVSEQTMCRTLKRLKWTHKKVSILTTRSSLLTIARLHTELYSETNLNVTHGEPEYAAGSPISSYSLTKPPHANVQATGSMAGLSMAPKRWFMLCLRGLRGGLYYQHIRRKATSPGVSTMAPLPRKYSTISCYTRSSPYALQPSMEESTLFLYATTPPHTNRWN